MKHPGVPRLCTSHHAVQYATSHSVLYSSLFPSACLHVHHVDKLRKAMQAGGACTELRQSRLQLSCLRTLCQQSTGHGVCIHSGAADMRVQFSAAAADAIVCSPDWKSCFCAVGQRFDTRFFGTWSLD